MGIAGLTYRLAGTAAVCLAAALAPVTGRERVLLLAAFGVGVAVAPVLPGHHRWSAWIAGPSALVLAIAPPSGLGTGASLGALALLGCVWFRSAGMERAVPALGLSLFTHALRTGSALLGAWVGVVVMMIVVANRVRGPGPTDRRPAGMAWAESDPSLVFGHRRGLQSLAVVVACVPVALASASLAVGLGPPPAGVVAADGPGGRLQAHPGLTGGLDTEQPVTLSDEVVLRVRAPSPRYWRGATYDQWDGRRWTSGATFRSVEWSSDTLDLTPAESAVAEVGDPELELDLEEPVEEVQHFTVTQSGLDVVVGAWRMTRVRSGARAATVGDDGTVRLTTPLPAGATWSVTSRLVPADADLLRRADPARLPADSPIVARYAREDDVTPEVIALAREITTGSPTTYDRIVALEDWIEANISYTRDIPALAEGIDAVHHLLFESRRGYCEQIGSALVVMLRSLGVPARLAVGFVPGSYDADTGEWRSRGTDAHAWAEIYFPGVGWQGFDPTAGVPLGPEADRADGSAPGKMGPPTGHARLAGAGAVTAPSVTAIAVAANRRRRIHRSATRSEAEQLAELQHRFDRCGQTLDRDWTPAMTLRDKAHDLTAAGVDPALAATAARALERAWFHDLDRLAGLDRTSEAVAVVWAGPGPAAMYVGSR